MRATAEFVAMYDQFFSGSRYRWKWEAAKAGRRLAREPRLSASGRTVIDGSGYHVALSLRDRIRLGIG